VKPHIRKIFWLYTLMFAFLIGYLIKICFYDSNSFVANSLNPRVSRSSEGIKRGSVLDADGEVLAESVLQDDGTYKRQYNHSTIFSHIVGYDTKGKSGIESKYNFMLETVNAELVQRMGKLIFGDEVKGNNVVLTVKSSLQQVAAEQLGNQRGALVALEPSTGRVLAMVSYPTFDSNTIDEDWESLHSDEKNSPLLNRATQGLYPPGSTFKIITAATALENNFGTDFSITCNGVKTFGTDADGKDITIHCYNNIAHGNEDMTKAFAKSCNTYFSTVGTELGAEELRASAERFGFNSNINFSLEYSMPSFPMEDDALVDEVMLTSIGQGRTLVSPLYMAMVTSAIANNGIMMQPYIVDHAQTSGGHSLNKTMPKKIAEVCSPEISGEVTDLMLEVVNSGTATNAAFSISREITETKSYYVKDKTESGEAVSGSAISVKSGSGELVPISVAGKTGTAENTSGDDHSWFVAFAPAENPQIAVAVVLENVGHGDGAITAAREVMKSYLENN
jgi:peptidoglycan glycosyltransferase